MLKKYKIVSNIFLGNACRTFLLLSLWLLPCFLFSQDEEVEKYRSRMGLSVTQWPEDTIELKGLVRAKIEGVYQKISDVEVEFFQAITSEEETTEELLGSAMTRSDGIASLKLKKALLTADENGYLNFIARFNGNDQLEEDEDDASVLPAEILLEPVSDDSLYALNVKLFTVVEGEPVPLEGADAVIRVKRMVGMLKVGDGTTDEEGMVEINFPTDLSGDDNGNILINASVEDFDEYGSLAAWTTQAWGKPVSSETTRLPRALWSPYPPTWLLATFLGLLAIIWGHYVHVIFELWKVKKTG